MDSSFLEDWLRIVTSNSSSSSSSPPPPPHRASAIAPSVAAPQIAHAWAQLRACGHAGVLESNHLAALQFLRDCGRSLHVAEPQARLLLPVLCSLTSADASALGLARGCAALLLSNWLRKSSSANLRHNRAAGKEGREIVDLVVRSTCKALEDREHLHLFISEAVLLLGTLSVAAHTSDGLRWKCQDVLVKCLNEKGLVLQGTVEEALAGVGYAIVSSHGSRLAALTTATLLLWSSDDGFEILPLHHALMLFHLMEWCGSTLRVMQKTSTIADAQVIVEEFARAVGTKESVSVKCTVVMSATGFLKALYTEAERESAVPSKMGAEQRWQIIIGSLEAVVASMSDDAVESQVSMIEEKINEKAMFIHNETCHSISFLEHWLHETGLSQISATNRNWLQCASLAWARCKGFPPHSSILLCLTVTLLNDVIPMANLYSAQLTEFINATKESTELTVRYMNQGNKLSLVQEELSSHTRGLLFQEVGGITRAMCEQYQSANESFRLLIETILWEYSRVLYQSHRLYYTLLRKSSRENKSLCSVSLDPADPILHKVQESIFLVIVMFCSFAVKQWTFSGQKVQLPVDVTSHSVKEVAVRVLDSLSCLEFFRHVQVPEYGAIVRDCVAKVASSESATASLVKMLPLYDNAINLSGPAYAVYNWAEDGVQMERLLFYFRVLPSCLKVLSELSFVNGVVPLMFLYMQYPSQNVAQASHTLFASFLSTNTDAVSSLDLNNSAKSGRSTTKEQVVAFYVKRALEVFPGVTPFDGLVLGVGAIVRHLPVGSPAILYCITCLVEKVCELYQSSSGDTEQPGKLVAEDSQGQLAGEIVVLSNRQEAARQIQTLLIHLILLVDLQVLPHLLKEVAKLVLGLPQNACMTALGESFDVIAGCDDFTRKPTIVPWLQTLSYLCTHPDARGNTNVLRAGKSQKSSYLGTVVSEPMQTTSIHSDGAINLNPSLGCDSRIYSTTDQHFQFLNDSGELASMAHGSRSRL